MPSIDPKDVPGIVGMMIRGELKCEICEKGAASGAPINPNDSFQMAINREVHKRMGRPDWKPNPNYRIPAVGYCGDHANKYNEELKKFYSEFCVCDVCGLNDG